MALGFSTLETRQPPELFMMTAALNKCRSPGVTSGEKPSKKNKLVPPHEWQSDYAVVVPRGGRIPYFWTAFTLTGDQGEIGLAADSLRMRTSVTYNELMKKVGIRELKERLSEYVQLARQGEEIQITRRGEIVAEMRPPETSHPDDPHPGLQELVRRGAARAPAGPNDPALYPRLERLAPTISAADLLDETRGER